MKLIKYGVQPPNIALVPDSLYHQVVTKLIKHAQRNCLCSIFIVDVDPIRDKELLVFSLLQELQAATWRGVEVRLLIGGSRRNFEVAESAQAARAISMSLGINSRWLTSHNTRGSHMKMVLVDDRVLLGSHNWTAGAFTDQTQDSVFVESPGMTAYLSTIFEEQWERASED